jgi:hypothetical protein
MDGGAGASDSGNVRAVRFIAEPITVEFERRPALEKRPGLPAAFVWDGRRYRVLELLLEWHDYERRGRMASNMRPEHAERAAHRGSRGVGRDYYRVRTDRGPVFEIYYDRAPRNVRETKGTWFVFREVEPVEGSDRDATE